MPVGIIVLFAHCCGHSLQNCANDYCISAQSGIAQILDFFSFITDLGQLEVTLEAKAGLSLGGFFNVGGVETVGLSLEGLAEINYQGLLYKNGELTDLLPSDLLWSTFQQIKKTLGLPSANKRIGAKTAFEVLKN